MKKLALSGKERRYSPAISLTIRYVLFGMLWILFSDSLLSWVSRDSVLWQVAHVHILKGVLFIGVTGAAIFYFVHNLHQTFVARSSDFTNLFDNNPYPMISVSADSYNIIDANDAAAALFEVGRQELLQQNLIPFVLECDRDRFKSEMLIHRVSFHFRKSGTWNLQTSGGTKLCLRIDAVHLAGSTSRQLLLALNNLTPQITAERELKDITQFLEQKIIQRTAHLVRLNEELTFRARETEKVNSELIFINERLQLISRQQSASLQKIETPAGIPLERSQDAIN